MKRRMIILPIETITNLMKDYCSQIGFPADAKPLTWLFNHQERKLALVIGSEEFTSPQPTECVRFDLQKIYGLGG